jgi:hypothetical protein
LLADTCRRDEREEGGGEEEEEEEGEEGEEEDEDESEKANEWANIITSSHLSEQGLNEDRQKPIPVASSKIGLEYDALWSSDQVNHVQSLGAPKSSS